MTEQVTGAPCPKCTRPLRPTERSCARCGLLASGFGKFKGESDDDPLVLEIEKTWTMVRSTWDDASAHERLIDQAARFQCLPTAARRYRQLLDQGPNVVAERRLQQIAVLIENAARAQAKDFAGSTSVRALRVVGYAIVSVVLAFP